MFMQALRSNTGLTLTEVMVATVIFAIGVSGTAALLITLINNNDYNKKLSAATALTQDRMEDVARLGYRQVDAAQGIEDYHTIANYASYKRITTVAANAPATNMKTVTVQVLWDNDARAVTLTTILAR